MTGRPSQPPPRSSRTGRPSQPPRSASRLVFLFPPSLGKPKAEARAEILEQNLAHELQTPVSIHVTTDYADLERRALYGEAHLVWAPAGICADLEPVARGVYKAVRNGLSTYRSALVVRSEDRLTLDRLAGLRAAWVDPHSVGGYLLAVDLLRRRGLDPDTLFSQQKFHGSHPDALNAVTGREADITAITAWTQDEASIHAALSMHVGPLARKLTVLTVTDEAPTDAMVLTSKLLPEDAERIADRLFSGSRRSSFLLAAMGAEGFVHTRIDEYRPLQRLSRRS